MKYLITTIIYGLLCIALTSCSTKEVYLFSYFTGEGDGLRLAYSNDGLTWTPLGNGVFLKPEIGKDKLMRDPSICKGKDGVFHMVWTSGWHDKIIGYSSTKDFNTWTKQKEIPVMIHESETKNSWAPELFYDEPSETFYIFWASTIPSRHSYVPASESEEGWNHRIYYTTTKDFESFSPTAMFFNPDFSVIDAAIIKDEKSKDYIMVLKNENSAPAEKNIRITRTKNIKNGFPTEVSEPITGDYWAEGPAPLFIDGVLYVYFDRYTQGKYGAVCSSDNGNTWEDISDLVSFPAHTRHGTIIPVEPSVVDNIIKTIK